MVLSSLSICLNFENGETFFPVDPAGGDMGEPGTEEAALPPLLLLSSSRVLRWFLRKLDEPPLLVPGKKRKKRKFEKNLLQYLFAFFLFGEMTSLAGT